MHILVLNAGASAKQSLAGAELRLPDPQVFFETRTVNTGELLEYDALLRQLKADRVSQLSFAAAADPKQWPASQPDVTILRGSNYIREGFDLGPVVPFLRHLRGPVVAVGVGAQAAAFRRLALPEGSVAFWREVAAKSTSLGVRGTFSAEVLESIGVRNVRVVGCPGIYRSGAATRPLRPLLAKAARVGLTLNRMLAGDYTSNEGSSRLAQRRLLAGAAHRPASRVYAQGEREEMLSVLGRAEVRAQALRDAMAAYGLPEDDHVAALLRHGLAAYLDVEAWSDDLARHVDVVVGLRLQGNMLALQQGIPTIPVVYDSRTREVADLFALPSVEIQAAGVVDLDGILEAADFSFFEAAYARNFASYRGFLEENGLPHRLGLHPAPEAERTPAVPTVRTAPADLEPEAPIFIVGTGRCGSTYLQTALSRTGDVWIWGEHAGVLRGLLKWSVEARANPMLNEFVFPFAEEDPLPRLKGEAFRPGWDLSWLNRLGPGHFARAEREAMLQLFARELPAGKRRWGFKEIRYGEDDGVLERLLELFPGARLVHLLRHPVDTVESSLMSWQKAETAKALGAGNHSALTAQYQRLMQGWVRVTERLLALTRQHAAARSFRIEEDEAMLPGLAEFLELDAGELSAAARASYGARNRRVALPHDPAQQDLLLAARAACVQISAPLAKTLGYGAPQATLTGAGETA